MSLRTNSVLCTALCNSLVTSCKYEAAICPPSSARLTAAAAAAAVADPLLSPAADISSVCFFTLFSEQV